MRLCVLGSGSRGNCTFIESGATRILVDGGFSGVEIQRRLLAIGVDIASLSAILVTHEHGDHVRGVAVLSRQYNLPVFANEDTFLATGKLFDKLYSYQGFETGTNFTFQNLQIHPFSVSHDAADPVGFVVKDDKWTIGYCTDTGLVSKMMRHRLSGCHCLVLEANHDPDLLKNGPYSQALQQRVRSKTGHLANADAGTFLRELLHDRPTHVVLAHISSTNNTPEIAMTTVMNELQVNGSDCGRLPQVSLSWQDRAGDLVDLQGNVVCR